MRRYLLKNRDFVEAATLAHVLPFVAGAVNASGFFIVGAYTSHVTGSVARIGDEIAQGHGANVLHALLLIVSFFAGAAGATAIVTRHRGRRAPPFAAALTWEAAVLTTVALIGIWRPRFVPALNAVTTALLCVAMGAQNALVTTLSGAIVRTTHLTGVVTDMGIETVQAWHWLRAQAAGKRLTEIVRLVGGVRTHHDLKKLRLHIAIFLSFLVGAIVGPILYLRHGLWSMGLPVIVLLALSAFDRMIGLRMPADEVTPAPAASPER